MPDNDTNTNTNTNQDGQQHTDTGGQSGAGTTGTQTSGGGATFTAEQQTAINALLANERRDTERKIKESDELKTLRAKAKRADDLEAAGKSDIDKATERAAKAEAEAASLQGRYYDALIRSEFSRLAADKQLSAQQIADAFALADRTNITVDADGRVTGADKSLDAVLKDRPYLAGAQSSNGQNGSRRSAPNINAGDQNREPTGQEIIDRAVTEGRQSGRYRPMF